MEFTALLGFIAEIGLMPALIGAFAYYFFKREKKREEYLAERDKEWSKTLDKNNETAYQGSQELMKVLLAEGSRREELMRQESQKREDIIRQEAEKRENMLMHTINGFSNNMEKLSNSLINMDKTLVQIDVRLTNMENNQKGARH